MTLNWMLSVLAMGLVTFALRIAPTLLPERVLKSRLLRALGILPLCVMVILVLSGIQWTDGQGVRYLAAQLAALVLVLIVYARTRNVFLSIAVGVGGLNAILYCWPA